MCLAIPGQIKRRFSANELPMGTVDFNGVERDVCLSYVPDAKIGEYVIVHVGFALSLIDPVEAERMLALLDELGQLVEAEEGSA